MPFPDNLKAALPIVTFAARHLLVVPFAIVVGCLLWTITYFVLLIVAVVFGGGIGSPLAFPGGIIAIVLMCAVFGWGIFAPASAVGFVFCQLLKLPRLAAIPVVYLSGFGLCYLLYLIFVESLTTHSMPSVWTVLENFTLYLSIPLGIYWWLTEGASGMFDVFRRWVAKRVRSKAEMERLV